ncbi:MAG: ferrochelatase [Acidobacteria bacterium]|nr:ferrochelatase [Acidobacteriota bacterium]MBW4044950.1 ferrochelatase [Acidobacteriota bacterium]
MWFASCASLQRRRNVAKSAVILLAHGTPDALDEIPEYLRNVTSGRPMPESVIEEIRHRYSLIGQSPLTGLTMEQGRLLAEKLDLPVYVGMRNWKPYIVDTVRQMRADGVTDAVAVCLAPQNSRTSVGLYRRAVFAEAGDAIKIDFVEGWADHPLLADAFADRLKAAFAREQAQMPVLFTAHSVPCRTIQTQPAVEGKAAPAPDPYPLDAKQTAALVAERFPGLRWFFAFQSQGMSGGPWIGPSVEDTLKALREEGHEAVMIQPIGFLCDHVEILYDIDIGFREFGEKIGLRVTRPESLNSSPLLTEALAELARGGLARLQA